MGWSFEYLLFWSLRNNARLSWDLRTMDGPWGTFKSTDCTVQYRLSKCSRIPNWYESCLLLHLIHSLLQLWGLPRKDTILAFSFLPLMPLQSQSVILFSFSVCHLASEEFWNRQHNYFVWPMRSVQSKKIANERSWFLQQILLTNRHCIIRDQKLTSAAWSSKASGHPDTTK